MKDLKATIMRYTEPSLIYCRCSSYVLKSIFESILGKYISESEFNEVMKETPYQAKRVGYNTFYRLRVKPNKRISRYYWGKGYEAKHVQQHG